MRLELYKKKRNFKKTREPKGKISIGKKHLYVIQKHAARHLHYDLRLELNGVLLSWAVPKGPCLDPSVKRLAVHVEDHPIKYGHFEGTIPKGQYGAGTVEIWDEGVWIPEDKNPKAAYQKGHLRFQLKAKKLHGSWSLIRFKSGDDKSWFLIKKNDEYAIPLDEYDILNATDQTKIIKPNKKSKRKSNKEEIFLTEMEVDLPKRVMPSSISPQLATLVNKIPVGDEWLHEMKFDGYRMITFKKGNNIKLISRNHKNWTKQFDILLDSIKALPVKNAIFDGEVVILDKYQKPNFQLLQNAIESGNDETFIYYIFDILYYEKYNLMSLPLIQRKNILHSILDTNKSMQIRLSDHIIGSGPDVFKKLCAMKLEGIISKNIHGLYEEKRTQTWLKAKCLQRQEFVIAGYTPPERSRHYLGSLYLGYFDKKDNLIYCGNVGTGFNQVTLKKIYDKLQKIKTTHHPFKKIPPNATDAIWVKPVLIAEVEFLEWTKDNILRQPSFKGLREDKDAHSITRENEIKLESLKIPKEKMKKNQKNDFSSKLTNPEKILYPEDKITKLDLANYYDQIQDWILPYITNRPLTLLRCPDHYKECFYQKRLNKNMPDSLYGILITHHEAKDEYIYIKDWAGLLALIQMGTLEIHAWGSKVSNVEFPDMFTIDLDPAPDVEWKQVVNTAKRIKENLDSMKLTSFVKSTGGKGLHVVVPIKPEYDWDMVKKYVHTFSEFLVQRYPDEYVSKMSKLKRKDKIYVDYLRNQRGATAISPYSTRARLGAPVSAPLHWNELSNDYEDNHYTIQTLPYRLKHLKKDPWEDFFKIKQSLKLDKFMKK